MIDNVIEAYNSQIVLPYWLVGLLTLGVIVDLFQFLWLMKRGLRKFKRAFYLRIEREMLGKMKQAELRGKP